MERESVVVLLSTYNGEKYLEEQLCSLEKQEGVDLSVLVRDDGSSDKTIEILEAWSKKFFLTWYTGENLKPALSFWHLLQHAPDSAFYAFCDQDDVWDADKLKVAVGFLEEAGDYPALYFCQTRLVDASLNEINSVPINPNLTYGEALSYNFVTGCTMVMNTALRNILLQYTPGFIRMHDIWIYDVAQAVGARVFFDPEPHISYRQHGGNVVGQANSFKAVWRSRIENIRRNECVRSRLAQELLSGYGNEMSHDNLALTKIVAGYKNNLLMWIRLLFTRKLRCSPFSIRVSSKLAILTRRF